MPVYQLTYFFQTGNFGWSENYPCSVSDPVAAETNFVSIKNLRLPMMPPDTNLIGGRISDVNIKGDSYPTTTGFPQPGTYSVTGGLTAADRELCVRVMMNAGPSKRGNRYLHGVPANQYTATKYAGTSDWVGLLGAFLSAILANSGTLTKIPGATAPPYFTYTPYTGYTEESGDFRKVGRPFGQPRGRRAVA